VDLVDIPSPVLSKELLALTDDSEILASLLRVPADESERHWLNALLDLGQLLRV
jgi:hypothetical protein